MPHSLGGSPATASPAPLQTLSLPAERALCPNPTLALALALTRLQEISEGRAALASLRPKDVVADPELNDALFALRSRIAQIEMRKLRANGR
jgi:hypothetical protein